MKISKAVEISRTCILTNLRIIIITISLPGQPHTANQLLACKSLVKLVFVLFTLYLLLLAPNLKSSSVRLSFEILLLWTCEVYTPTERYGGFLAV